jgi:hypothetical protein
MAEDFTFTFEALKAGDFGLTQACGSVLAEAAAFCLYQHKHPTPVVFTVNGDMSQSGFLVWDAVTQQHGATYADLPEATELGACGIAILIATRITGVQFVQRSVRGPGSIIGWGMVRTITACFSEKHGWKCQESWREEKQRYDAD